MPAESSVRDRRRAETVREIKAAAVSQLAEAGPGGLSLRGVARAVGMTVQSLYHYFDSRDALLTLLVREGYDDLADAVRASVEATRGRPSAERRVAAVLAFRAWALAHRATFLLLFGTPVPGFEPAPEAGADEAAWRLAAPFAEVIFQGWTPAQLAAVALPPGGESIATATIPAPSIPPDDVYGGLVTTLPPGALTLFIELRARMHGLVMLELLGKLSPLQEHAEAVFVTAAHRMSAEVDALRTGLPEES